MSDVIDEAVRQVVGNPAPHEGIADKRFLAALGINACQHGQPHVHYFYNDVGKIQGCPGPEEETRLAA